MGSNSKSLASLHASYATNGPLVRMISDAIPNTTSQPTTAQGWTAWQRYPNPWVMPTVGAGLTGMYLTVLRALSADKAGWVAGIECLLGTYTEGSGLSNAGSMPSSKFLGYPVNANISPTASSHVWCCPRSGFSGGTPSFTVTYTDQDGNTGAVTSALQMASVPVVNTAYDLTPYFASGDTGIRAVTGVTRSAGTLTAGGIFDIYGILPIFISDAFGAFTSGPPLLGVPLMPWLVTPGDKIAFYRSCGITSANLTAMLVGVAEN